MEGRMILRRGRRIVVGIELVETAERTIYARMISTCPLV